MEQKLRLKKLSVGLVSGNKSCVFFDFKLVFLEGVFSGTKSCNFEKNLYLELIFKEQK